MGSRSQGRPHAYAPGQGQVVADTGARHAESHPASRRQVDRHVGGRRPGIDVDIADRAGHGDRQVSQRFDGQAATEGFQNCGVRAVAHKAVRQSPCPSVERSGPRDSEVGVPAAATVLDEGLGSGRQYLKALHQTNLTRSPGDSRAGGSRSALKRSASQRPIRCQPPGEDVGYTAQ